MKPLWNYKDIFDLEYFFHKDSALRHESLVERDRGIFLQHIEPRLKETGAAPENRAILRQWLEYRRRIEFGATGSLSPGALFAEAHRTLRLICLVVGLFFGSIAGLTFFNYAGTTPVNILSFLAFFIFTQIAILFLLLASLVIRYLLYKNVVALPLGIRIMGHLTIRTILWGHRNILGRMWADSRDSLAASLGLLKGAQQVYGSLFYWPIFILIQLLAIGTNAGILAATLFRILTSDIAFGWQSTVQFSAPALHRLVSAIAAPWSGFFPADISHPSLAAIEGSRIILKDGISHLATENLVSWWPFLVLCLLVYGLLPRVLLYFAALIMQHRGLSRLQFRHSPCLSLFQRMQTPRLSTRATPEFKVKPAESSPSAPTLGDTPEAASTPLSVLVLIPSDIAPDFEGQPLHDCVAGHGFSILDTIRFMESYEADQTILKDLTGRKWASNHGIFIVMESWMPPLVAFLTYLGEIRQAVGPGIPLYIELIGKPAADTGLTSIPETDWLVWARKITALGDPLLILNPITDAQS